ncbi:hypothetical protein TanjilG_03377 [Lupinus angustifolius]|uniref:Phospholipase A-2-activating protein n=1 Tax=Lupinus angustifolius TaxID=3871 RepID=A0A4P1RDI1_LUPAN|nr:hypothetical protein TanjilG_03377 [Lupinus angustifolius]
MEIDFNEYQLRCELHGHEDDVRGICVCGNDGIATSSRDRTVRFWSLDSSDKRKFACSKILLGHSSFVGPLVWISPNQEFPQGGIVSGGMDTLVLVWDLKTVEKVHTLQGHKLQVTGIALDDNGDIISSSVDCTLRRWRNGQSLETWEAHKAPIQAVIKLPSGDGEIVTGNAHISYLTCFRYYSSLRLWAVSGEVLMEMVGHTAIVYSVDSHSSGLIVSGSEDRFAKIWKDGVCVQSIEHPGCVWDAKFLENGDIVTACSDGTVRIWTTHQDTVADQLELDLYTSQLSQYKASRKRVGGLKLEELPGLDSLKIPGLLSMVLFSKIGEVVDGPEESSRPFHDGAQYDYVFDVDIGDGMPIRKLPYNRSEFMVVNDNLLTNKANCKMSPDNPYDVADKWLLKESLPLSFREQIVQFILQNTGQKDITFDASFRDPYTGYISAKPTFKHIPKKGMLVFEAAQFDGILKKINEFNNALLSDQILDAFSSCSSSSNKNLHLSYSTLILNYTVLLIELKDQEGQSQVLSAALEIVENENVEGDSKFRALVGIGSLMLEGLVKKIALDFDVLNFAKSAKGSKEAKIAEVGSDIELLTKQS